jgi:LuxR family maltose regulon positive regulatory protein
VSFAHGKIQPPLPRRGQLLARPQIEARLRDALDAHRAVLVCAPAGYGKTALLVRALVPPPAGHGLAWVSLDPGDDLHRLLECLLAALEPFDPPWRVAPEGVLASALRGDTRGRQQAVDELVNALDACEVAHGAIVLDDLHHLEDDGAQHFLARLIERLGTRWTLVLATREQPAALLARVAAAGELAHIREADLRFTADEVQAWFATQGMDAETARALHARTAGWAAGLRLALSGARGAGPGAAIDRAAFDFLATEVLAHLDADLRAFLLDTSVLYELDAPRCAALTGDARAARWLDEIERRGLFASVVDEASGTLRLHDLFRDALQHRLRVERPEDWRALLQRAAAIETDPVRRQSLWLAAGCFDEAALALLEAGGRMNVRGAAATTQRLIDAFPASFAAGSAVLQRIAALTAMTLWHQGDAERHYAQAERLYAACGDAAAAQAMAARRAAVLVTLGRLSEAAAVLEALDRVPLIDVEARLLVATATSWLHVERGENYAVAPAFERLVQQLDPRMSLDNWGMVPGPRQTACRGMGPLLLRWGNGALAVAGDEPVPLRAFAQLTLGWQALWQGRHREAAERLERAVDDARWSGNNVIVRSHTLALSALLALARGDAAEAVATMRTRVDEHPSSYGDWGLWHTLYLAARVAAACGDAAALRDWLQRLLALQPMLPEVSEARLHPVAGLHGSLAALEGRRDDALSHWHDVLAHEESADLFGQAGEVRLRLAVMRLQAGAHGRDEAAALLRPLLERVDDGPRGVLFAARALATLAREDWSGRLDVAEQATLRAWAEALAQPAAHAVGFVADAAASSQMGAARAEASAVAPDRGIGGEKLTARELEVLALIARGQSNKLIARALDLSLHTVKRHVANSLAKLGVASRGQAAAWFHAQQSSSNG